ncbi:MAG TPA: DUF1778 domain-containing protein, partial [Vicinamibacterales bacterium]|nr:DUF1778 domain-containing protein [Vicinamibacterales bacterium]
MAQYAATRKAQSVLLERRFFQLDKAAFRRFNEALDAPPADNPAPPEASRQARSLGVMSGAVSPPEHLTAEHDLSGFDCGVPELDDWLRTRARVADIAGIRAILLHAVNDDAKRFYLHHGFAESPVDPMTMMITLADVE